MRWVSVLLIAVLGSSSASGAGSASAPDRLDIVLLHVNDSHGQTEGTARAGGEARLATAVAQVRKEAGHARVFLVHCGDILSRGDALTRRTLGRANFDLMNRLTFDAWTPGNGDLYDGLDVLSARIAQAKFPTLAANVKVKATGKPLADGFVLQQAGPATVAFFGLCFFKPQGPGGSSVVVENPIEVARRLVPQLRKQADLVVAMTHIGVLDDTQLARAIDGIDVILGAHTHTAMPNGLVVRSPAGRAVLICQTGGALGDLGRVNVQLARRAGGGYAVSGKAARLIRLDMAVKIDPETKALLATWNEPAATQPERRSVPTSAVD